MCEPNKEHNKGPLMWRHAAGMQTPDLAGGGWRWRGRGAMGAFGSGGILLMWESTCLRLASKSQNPNWKRSFHKHAPERAWPLFLYVRRRSLGRGGGGSRGVRTRMSGRRVFGVLPEQTSQRDRSGRGHPRVPQMARHAVQASDRIFSTKTHLKKHASCTARVPVWPRVRL